jgi:hypothetical protein
MLRAYHNTAKFVDYKIRRIVVGKQRRHGSEDIDRSWLCTSLKESLSACVHQMAIAKCSSGARAVRRSLVMMLRNCL